MKRALPSSCVQGGQAQHLYTSDNEPLFRQEAFFQYLFGVNDAEGFYGAFDLRTQQAILFMPRLPESYAVWMGHILTPQEVQAGVAGARAGLSLMAAAASGACQGAALCDCWGRFCLLPALALHSVPSARTVAVQAKYAVDEVRYVDELAAVLEELAPPCLHVLTGGVNTDRRAPLPLLLLLLHAGKGAVLQGPSSQHCKTVEAVGGPNPLSCTACAAGWPCRRSALKAWSGSRWKRSACSR